MKFKEYDQEEYIEYEIEAWIAAEVAEYGEHAKSEKYYYNQDNMRDIQIIAEALKILGYDTFELREKREVTKRYSINDKEERDIE